MASRLWVRVGRLWDRSRSGEGINEILIVLAMLSDDKGMFTDTCSRPKAEVNDDLEEERKK